MTREAGRISVFLAVAITGLLAVLGAAVDATGQLRTLLRADNLAAEAARAAGQAVDVDAVAGTGQHQLDRDQAIRYAAEYLAAAGHDQPGSDWTVEPSPDGTAVEITVQLTYQPRILGLFGRPPTRVTGTATAVLVSQP